ncbi:hypothetical protein BGW36DRAFT_412252 [Talaromyces proteolyticus]|uniref:Uncharacterized protein n=1 Tax=Talaromyces proteolyticus TaxID=1131652 RepID=A0AAD4PSQ3_9EURO|nr:uncharacterized protein BGW36DRAFT_412252 [Talaromyces proteolyticus]KAH8689458.1 hypothetical protein BGW36DRAFT_412252 [Talaromyces proteolyticus]
MKAFLPLAALIACVTAAPAARDAPSKFKLIISASDSSINNCSLQATNDNEVDIMGTLQPAQYPGEEASVFYFDSVTGDLVTDSDLTGRKRYAYTLYSNYTSSLRFDVQGAWDESYSPKFTIANDGTFSPPNNLTWSWCPDDFNVGNGIYLPGSITLGPVFHGCEALYGVKAVAA